jgi:peptidoglycan/LPS O-acetylase OafA/YrhL
VRPTPLYPLTAVRFLAAFCVVVFHFGGDLLPHLPVGARLIFEPRRIGRRSKIQSLI